MKNAISGLRGPRWLLAVAFAMIAGMYCTNQDMGGDPTSPRGDGQYRPVLARGDGHMLYLMARSTALDGDWDFGNDLKRFGDPWHEPVTKTGRKSIVHPIGPALVWTPLILAAQGGAVTANLFGADIPLHGYTLWHQRIVFFSSVLFAIGAALLSLRVASRSVGGKWAPTYAVVCALLGTSLTYYSTYMPSYSHAMDAFACSLFVWYWTHSLGQNHARRWLILGVLLGFASLIRVQESAFGILVAYEVLFRLVVAARDRDPGFARIVCRWVGGGLLCLLVALVVFIPQLLEWHIVFGDVTGIPQGARFTRFNAPMVSEVLFSARNGWFSTTPLAYAGCIGLLFLPRRARLVAVGLLLVVVMQVYLNSTVLDWWSGASFGQRRMCNVTLPVAVGLCGLIWRAGTLAARLTHYRHTVWHGLLWAIAGTLVVWNVSRVYSFRGGRPAPDQIMSACCSGVPAPLRRLAKPIFERTGNPFAFPANALFSLTHDVPLSRWDRVVGLYPLVPGLADLRDDARFFSVRGQWNVGAAGLQDFLVDGWSRSVQLEGRAARFTIATAATALVPNLMPDSQRFRLELFPAGSRDVVVMWNGVQVARSELQPGWNVVTFEIGDMPLHMNELTIVSKPAFMVPTPGHAVAGRPAGVAVGALTIELVRPER
ncbi:MAG: hypothetical protein HOV81_40570 [Kofleriaceae bacterium]|nr:hypothetical protein [Kofleriaceae bacterium]